MPESLIAGFDGGLLQAIGSDTTTMSIGGIWTIFTVICLWKIFKKAKQAGWKSIIPFYNVYTRFKIAGRSGWWVLSLIFPPIFAIIMIVSYFNVCKKFDKGWLFALGLLFFNPIFLAILAFGGSKYNAKN